MRKGGYKLIDLSAKAVTTTGVEFPGVYDEIEGNYRKQIRLTGLVIGGVEYTDISPLVTLVGDDYHIIIDHAVVKVNTANKQKIRELIITDEDVVKYVDYTL